ncbi:MAG: hypothetical protein ABI480_07645 [Chitinophagaceae bacterium]
MKNTLTAICSAAFLFLLVNKAVAQRPTDDSVRFDYRKIFSLCLDGNVSTALIAVETDGSKKISERNQLFKTAFENRFKYEEDKSGFLDERRSGIDSLLAMYQGYWRMALLHPDTDYDKQLVASLTEFLQKNYLPFSASIIKEDSLDSYLKKYVASNHLHSTGFGKTGKLYDLLVWKTETDTVYSFALGKEILRPRVVFMDDFVTLGWEEYATLGKLYPGGWTIPTALYCVRKAYDLNSESFLISYLAHEGRHFADTKLFPELSSPDLEYRAKLVELSLADKTLYDLIDFFITNANYDSKNGHSVADYCAIRDLSKAIFHVEFEKDKSKWQQVGRKKINAEAAKIVEANTTILLGKGPKVKKYIKS